MTPPGPPTITAFERSPDGGKGLARGHTRSLGVRGSGPALLRSSGFLHRDERALASFDSSLRADSDL